MSQSQPHDQATAVKQKGQCLPAAEWKADELGMLPLQEIRLTENTKKTAHACRTGLSVSLL